MSITLHADTRVVVVPVAIDEYDTPAGVATCGASALESLPRIKADLALLNGLFSSEPYRCAGFQVLDVVAGDTAGAVSDRLNEVKRALAARPFLTAIVYWTGHGSTVQDELRLATRECFEPMGGSDGVAPGEVVGKLADARLRALVVLLDVCQAAAASADVGRAAAKRSFERSSQNPFGLGALFSAYPFERAQDGVFVECLARLLRDGPSVAAMNEMQHEEWEAFNPHNRLLTLKEIEEALHVEFDVARKANQLLPSPDGMHTGRAPRIFPNPRFQQNAPAVLVADARRRRVRAADAETHFLPKARGLEPGEYGWFFSGRRGVSREIVDWLECKGPAGSVNLFVLTGEGGTGKSAVIGRLVALSDEGYREVARAAGWDEVADQVDGTVPPSGGIDAALHLRKMTTQQVVYALADLLRLDPPQSPIQLAPFVAHMPTTANETGRPIHVVFDALDESEEPALIAQSLIRPLAAKGWRILVASRRAASHRGADYLLPLLGSAHQHDLDHEPTAQADIAAYVERRLKSSPTYAELPGTGSAVATAVARQAAGKFLYARITTASLLQRPSPIDLARIEECLAADVNEALLRELAQLDAMFKERFAGPEAGATALLGALAWSEGQGLPVHDGIWTAVGHALTGAREAFNEDHAQWLIQEGGRFIVESGDGDQAVYRLYHQSLNDHFRAGIDSQPVIERIARALELNVQHAGGWGQANPYLVRHLSTHLVQLADQLRLRRLLFSFSWMSAKLERLGIQALLDDYAHCRQPDEVLQRVVRVLSMSAHILARAPDQLATQLLGRLGEEPSPEIRSFCDEARQWRGATWFLPLTAHMEPPGAMLRVIEGHTAAVSSVAYSPNGIHIVTGSHDATLRLWDALSGQPVGVPMRGHGHVVHTVAFSPDGTLIASGSADKTVRLWDAETCLPVGSPMQHEDSVVSLAFSPDGTRIVAGIDEGKLRLWRVKGAKSISCPNVSNCRLTCVAFSPCGRYFVAAHTDSALRLYDANTLEVIGAAMQGHTDWISSVAFSPDGARILSGSRDKTLRLWEVDGGAPVGDSLLGHASYAAGVAFSPDGTRVISGSFDASLRLWDAHTGQPIGFPMRGHTNQVLAVAFSPDGTRVASGSSDGTLRLWDGVKGEIVIAPREADETAGVAAFSRDGLRMVSPTPRGTGLQLWDVISGQHVGTPTMELDQVVSHLTFSPDGNRILSAANLLIGDSTLQLWDARSGQPIGALMDDYEGEVTSVAFSHDGTRIALGGNDSSLRLRDGKSGHPISEPMLGPTDFLSCVAFSPDDSRIVAGAWDNSIWLWDVKSGAPACAPILGHDDKVECVAFSPDGLLIASGDYHGVIRLSSATSGDPVGSPICGHESPVTSIAFSPDGKRFVSGGNDKVLRLWDRETGNAVCALQLRTGISTISWSGDTVNVCEFSGAIHSLVVIDPATPKGFMPSFQPITQTDLVIGV